MSLKNKMNQRKIRYAFNQAKAFHLSRQTAVGRGKHGRPSFAGKSKGAEAAQDQ